MLPCKKMLILDDILILLYQRTINFKYLSTLKATIHLKGGFNFLTSVCCIVSFLSDFQVYRQSIYKAKLVLFYANHFSVLLSYTSILFFLATENTEACHSFLQTWRSIILCGDLMLYLAGVLLANVNKGTATLAHWGMPHIQQNTNVNSLMDIFYTRKAYFN